MPNLEWIVDVVGARRAVISALVSRNRAIAHDARVADASLLIFQFTFIGDVEARQVAGIPMAGLEFDDLECACIHLAAAADFDAYPDHALGIVIGEFGVEWAFFVFQRRECGLEQHAFGRISFDQKFRRW